MGGLGARYVRCFAQVDTDLFINEVDIFTVEALSKQCAGQGVCSLECKWRTADASQ